METVEILLKVSFEVYNSQLNVSTARGPGVPGEGSMEIQECLGEELFQERR